MPHPKAGYMDAIFFLPRTNFLLASRGEPYMTLFSVAYGLHTSHITGSKKQSEAALFTVRVPGRDSHYWPSPPQIRT